MPNYAPLPSRYLLMTLLAVVNLSAQTGPDIAKAVATYCSGCHDGRMRSPSGAPLDPFDTARIAANSDLWARAYRQIQAGTMPPFGRPGRIGRPRRPC